MEDFEYKGSAARGRPTGASGDQPHRFSPGGLLPGTLKVQTMKNPESEPPVPNVPFKDCPIATSLGVLGRKWTLLIIRDIGWKRADRFSGLLRTIPGLTPRVLAMRLVELEQADLIRRVEEHASGRQIHWTLTPKGQDIVPVLMRLVAFGSKWYPERVFGDDRPRRPDEVYPPGIANHPWITVEQD